MLRPRRVRFSLRSLIWLVAGSAVLISVTGVGRRVRLFESKAQAETLAVRDYRAAIDEQTRRVEKARARVDAEPLKSPFHAELRRQLFEDQRLLEDYRKLHAWASVRREKYLQAASRFWEPEPGEIPFVR